MISSMTGFGRGEAADESLRIQVDVRSVNHRYLDVQIRMPKLLAPVESEIREELKKNFSRGHVEVYVNVQRFGGGENMVQANLDLAEGVRKALETIAAKLQLENKPSLDLIVRQQGVLEIVEDEHELDAVKPVLHKALAEALQANKAMRQREGKMLTADLIAGIDRLSEHLVELEKDVPGVQNELADRFRQRVQQWAGEAGLDENRLQQEAWLMLSRMDVHEELTRLAGHLNEMKRYLGADEAVGKRLDFLAQESHREINTCGNKVQGMAISKRVVEIKNEIEKIREQVQNVE